MRKDFEVLGLEEGATVAEVRAARRALARRWHPDRFLPGPEREWANQRMAEINRAYHACLPLAKGNSSSEEEKLRHARKLIENGQLEVARKLLIKLSMRTAEWNYLFGIVLLRMAEYRKALLYLSVAAHQQPGNPKYLRAQQIARRLQGPEKKPLFFGTVR